MKRLAILSALISFEALAGDIVTHPTDCTQRTPSFAAQVCVEQDGPSIYCSNSDATAFEACSATSGEVCFPSLGCLRSTGSFVYLDNDLDGVYDEGESNSLSWAVSSAGDVTVPGDLTVTENLIVVGEIDSANVAKTLSWATLNTNVPTAGNCIAPWLDYFGGGACGYLTSQVREFRLEKNYTLTGICAFLFGGQMDSDDVFTFRLRTPAGTNYGEIVVRQTGGTVGPAPDADCIQPLVTQYTAGTSLWWYIQSVAGSPAAGIGLRMELRGR